MDYCGIKTTRHSACRSRHSRRRFMSGAEAKALESRAKAEKVHGAEKRIVIKRAEFGPLTRLTGRKCLAAVLAKKIHKKIPNTCCVLGCICYIPRPASPGSWGRT